MLVRKKPSPRRRFAKRSANVLLAVYLGLSPVYWLPGVAVGDLRIAKLSILIAAAVLVGIRAISRRRFHGLPPGFLGPVGLFLLLAVSAPGFLQADQDEAISAASDYLACYLVLWTVYVARSTSSDIPKTFAMGGSLIVVAAILTVSASVVGWPSWYAPVEFNRNFLSVAGFGARRTGWSNGLALFVPTMFVLIAISNRPSRGRYVLAATGTIAIIASQLTVGGRAGLLASLLGVVSILWFYRVARGRVIFTFLAMLLLAGVVFTMYSGEKGLASELGDLETHLRLDRLETRDDSKWDRFSAGRLGSLQHGVSRAMERPFMGYGFGNAIYGGAEIHNLWLKLWLESGVLLPAVLLAGILWTVKRTLAERHRGKLRRKTPRVPANRASDPLDSFDGLHITILLQGMIISMFEPNALIGSFQATAIWWFSAGAIARLRRSGRSANPREPD